MTAKPRTLAQLAAHPWVESVSDERSTDDGIWIYTRPGFVNDAGGHTIHEPTVKGCLAAFAEVSEWSEDPWLVEDAPAVRPVLPGERTPPPAPSHGDAAPTLPELRADAAAGRPVSLAAVATARRRRREDAAMAMEGVRQLLDSCAGLWGDQLHCRDGWIVWAWHGQAGRAVDTASDLGWIKTRDGLGLTIHCRITDAGRAALAARPSL